MSKARFFCVKSQSAFSVLRMIRVKVKTLFVQMKTMYTILTNGGAARLGESLSSIDFNSKLIHLVLRVDLYFLKSKSAWKVESKVVEEKMSPIWMNAAVLYFNGWKSDQFEFKTIWVLSILLWGPFILLQKSSFFVSRSNSRRSENVICLKVNGYTC